jgi:hypothetical protein
MAGTGVGAHSTSLATLSGLSRTECQVAADSFPQRAVLDVVTQPALLERFPLRCRAQPWWRGLESTHCRCTVRTRSSTSLSAWVTAQETATPCGDEQQGTAPRPPCACPTQPPPAMIVPALDWFRATTVLWASSSCPKRSKKAGVTGLPDAWTKPREAGHVRSGRGVRSKLRSCWMQR